MSALHTDLYELTMAAGYFASGKAQETAVFELFVRRMPAHRDYLIAAGLQQAVEYLLGLKFTEEQIGYLRGLPHFRYAPTEFWEYLAGFRFTGDLFAMPEGTPFFAGEPIAIVRAPIIEAQIPETFLLATFGFQSMIAAKAARIVAAAGGKNVAEFGARRAHGPEAGVLAGRAAYLAGCAGTSNVEAAFRYGMPVYGTAAHSWVLAFLQESEAFRCLQELLGEGTIYLIDSYDTLEGARKAAALGKPLWGVRLDSGDLDQLSRKVRRILDDANLPEARIIATGDLNEVRVAELVARGAPIDAFGVGTELTTSADSPAVSAVYKLVELHGTPGRRYVAKYSADKETFPGPKQVFRYASRDIIANSSECDPNLREEGTPDALLRPVLLGGQLAAPLPSLTESRNYCASALARIGRSHSVEYSEHLQQLSGQHRSELKV